MQPQWLAEFQAHFGAMLRARLDRGSGTLTAKTADYPAALLREALASRTLGAHDRLAVYNRQYWFRLFTVFYDAFPLTTRLFGHWGFNEHAARFLQEHPPRGWDISNCADGFDDYLAALEVQSISPGPGAAAVPIEAIRQAARIDTAFRRVFESPPTPHYRPSAADAARLLESRLQPSPTCAVLEEAWPLCKLRRELEGDPGETPVLLPDKLPAPQFWAVCRKGYQLGQLALEPLEARLFRLLGTHAVGEALGQLEADCPPRERAELPAKAQKWLARSVELGFWSGLTAR